MACMQVLDEAVERAEREAKDASRRSAASRRRVQEHHRRSLETQHRKERLAQSIVDGTRSQRLDERACMRT